MPKTPHSSFSLSWGPTPDLCLADFRPLGFGCSDFLLSRHFGLARYAARCLKYFSRAAVPDGLGLAHGDVDGSLPID